MRADDLGEERQRLGRLLCNYGGSAPRLQSSLGSDGLTRSLGSEAGFDRTSEAGFFTGVGAIASVVLPLAGYGTFLAARKGFELVSKLRE